MQFVYFVTKNSQQLSETAKQFNKVIFVDGFVENHSIESKKVMTFDHHYKGGSDTSLGEVLDNHNNLESISELSVEIENYEKINEDYKILFVTPQLDADAIIGTALIVHILQSDGQCDMTMISRWMLEAICFDCDYLYVPLRLKMFEKEATIFNQILKEMKNEEAKFLEIDIRNSTLKEKEELNSNCFYMGVMRIINYLQDDEALIFEYEYEQTDNYIQNQNKLKDLIRNDNRIKIYSEIAVFNAINIKSYCDPRNWYSILPEVEENKNKKSHDVVVFVREIVENNKHKAWTYSIALKPNPNPKMNLNSLWDLMNNKEKNNNPNALEHWGGRSTIGGSPRSEGSQLSLDDVLDIISYWMQQQ